MNAGEIRAAEREIAGGRHHLVFVAPERLLTPRFLELAAPTRRRELRDRRGALHQPVGARLPAGVPPARGASRRSSRPPASTPTPRRPRERVREDIVEQLRLDEPRCWSARSTGRTSSTASCRASTSVRQVRDVLRRHAGEAAIVYCLCRRDAEDMAEHLAAEWRSRCALPRRHGGRRARRTQERFAAEEIDVVGGDRRVRHGHRPQRRPLRHPRRDAEVDRALPAGDRPRRPRRPRRRVRAVLLGGGRAALASAARANDRRRRRRRDRDGQAPARRHAPLRERAPLPPRRAPEYFGQPYDGGDCGACDVCLGEVEGLADATVLAQKILSCVARTEERFGIEHVVDVLVGGDERASPAVGARPPIDVRSASGHAAEERGERHLPAHRRRLPRAHLGRPAGARAERGVVGGDARAVARSSSSSHAGGRPRRRVSRRRRGGTSIRVSSRAYGGCGGRSLLRAACRRSWSCTIPRCASWHASGRPRSRICGGSAASARRSSRRSDRGSSRRSSLTRAWRPRRPRSAQRSRTAGLPLSNEVLS